MMDMKLAKELMHSAPGFKQKLNQDSSIHNAGFVFRRSWLALWLLLPACLFMNVLVEAATTNADFTLDDGTVDSPLIRFIDADDAELVIQKLDSGEATFVNSEGRLCFEPSGDTDDILCFETSSDLLGIFWEGISAIDPGIRINAIGQLEYRDEDDSTWVAFDDLGSGTNLIDGIVSEDKLAASLVFDDGDVLNLSAIDASSETEGLILPQADDTSAAIAEGQISWDRDDDTLYIGTGDAQVQLNTSSGDISAVGDVTSGEAFTATDGNDGNSLFFEGATSDGNEVQLTAADAGSDVVVTIPASTTTLVGTDTTDTLINKTLTSPTLTSPTMTDSILDSSVSGSAILDEDTLVSDSATQLATQQSIKAYVDSQVGSAGDISAVGDVTTGAAFTATAGSDGNALFFEGATSDANEVQLTAADAGSDVTVTIPAATTTLVGTDTTDTLTNKTLTSPTISSPTISSPTITTAVLNTSVSGSAVLDEDTLVSDSANQLATQQSIKAYVDTQVSSSGDITDVGDSTGPTAFTGANDGNQLIFEGSTDDTNELTLVAADAGSDVTVTIPASTTTLVGTDTTDTLTNKTLTSPTINSPTISSPTITTGVLNTSVSGSAILDEDTLASDSASQLATQQSIKAYVDSQVGSSGDISAVGDVATGAAFTATAGNDGNALFFEGATSDTNEVQLTAADAGSDVTVTIPAATTTLIGTDTTDTLSNKTLTSPAINSPTITTGVLNTSVSGTAILDEDTMGSDSATQLATQQSIKAYVDSQSTAGDFDDSTFTVFDNTDNTKILSLETSGITTGTTRTLTAPDFDGTIGTLAGTETLTNKTLTSPTIGSAVLNTGVSGTAVLDEDAMGSDSATQLATQQSIKAYVDAQVGGSGDITDVGDATGPTAFTGANDGNQLIFEGTTDDTNELTLVAADAGSDVTVTIPASTTTLIGTDTTDTLTNKTLTSPAINSPTITTGVLNASVSGTAILDEDAMGSDSATQLATQQSIKAYVDSQSMAGDFDDSTFTIFDNTDNTKILAVEASSITTGTTRTLTVPDFDGTISTIAGTETLTNKTLTSPAINSPTITTGVLNTSVSGTAILDEDAMGSDSATQLATQQSIKAYVDAQIGGSGDVTDVGDSTGPTAFTGANDGNQLIFEGTTDDTNELTLVAADAGSDVTVTIPASTTTLVGTDTTDTLTNKTLTSPVINSPTITTGIFNTSVSGSAILDEDAMGSDSATQLATQQSIKAYVDSQSTAGDFDDSTFTVYDNADNTKILSLETSGITTGTTRTLTAPDFDGTISTIAGTETLTNKTLTSPTITTGVLNTSISGTAILDEDAMGSDSATWFGRYYRCG